MFKNTVNGIAWFFTAIGVFAYLIFVFMGLEYIFRGNYLISAMLTLCVAVGLVVCLIVMCKSKASRNKRVERPKEIISVILSVVILLAGSFPATMFFFVITHEEDLNRLIADTRIYALDVDDAYRHYAYDRIRKYQNKQSKKDIYRYLKVNSLQRRLIPEDLSTICVERKNWLSSLLSSSVWNLSTPKNLYYVITAADDWSEQYKTVSEIIYQGEEASAFANQKESAEAKQKYQNFVSFRWPDHRCMISALVCFMFIFVKYFHTRRPKNVYQGRHF